MAADGKPGYGAGIYLGILQLVFTLTWTVYVIFLPRLAESVGVGAASVAAILLIDQAIFTVTDLAMGLAADRVSRTLGRLGRLVIAATIVSALAFLALPFLAGSTAASAPLFFAATLVWVVTSSALRAPPLMLLGKYAPRPHVPWLSGLALIGIGVAAAVSPYLGVVLRDADPRLPFILSSVALVLVVLALTRIERRLAGQAGAAREEAPPPERIGTRPSTLAWFAGAVLVLALGFQVHFAFNSAPAYLRFAARAELQWLMPVFWIGFCAAMLPASVLTKRLGGLRVVGAGALVAALAALGTYFATGLVQLIVAQLVAGAAWGAIMMSAISAAQAIGHTGAEGRATGLFFSGLALAAFLRIGMVVSGTKSDPAVAQYLQWVPALLWTIGGATLLWLISVHRQQTRAETD